MGVYCCPRTVCPRLFANLKDQAWERGVVAALLDYDGTRAAASRMMKNELSLKSGFSKKESVEGGKW